MELSASDEVLGDRLTFALEAGDRLDLAFFETPEPLRDVFFFVEGDADFALDPADFFVDLVLVLAFVLALGDEPFEVFFDLGFAGIQAPLETYN